ncbi:hypothetical protein J6590_047561 [Homalodisca vitripennis]|nr:hypothetical protein J6590_047561 [Homalodisca vitripennis]
MAGSSHDSERGWALGPSDVTASSGDCSAAARYTAATATRELPDPAGRPALAAAAGVGEGRCFSRHLFMDAAGPRSREHLESQTPLVPELIRLVHKNTGYPLIDFETENHRCHTVFVFVQRDNSSYFD